MKTKLTITTPSYKQPAELSRLLSSLSNQTFKDFKVLILDDCSGVDFSKILSGFSDLNIEVLVNEKNLGAMKNIAHSIFFKTDTEYIISIHEDDFLKTNYFEEAVKVLDSQQALAFCICPPVWVAGNTEYKKEVEESTEYDTYDATEFTKQILNLKSFMFGSVVYRVNTLKKEFWRLDEFFTFCDKVLLIEILENNNMKGVSFHKPFIFVHDHSMDAVDTRADGVTLSHSLKYYSYLKERLSGKISQKDLNKKITNSVVMAYMYFKNAPSFINFYKTQKEYDLVELKYVSVTNIVGLIFGIKFLFFINKIKKSIIK